MNDNAAKWIAALRSGDYSQGRSRLRTQEGYCCLGVACEVYRQETGEGQWLGDTVGGHFLFRTSAETVSAFLPGPVCDWLGVIHDNGARDDTDGLNDADRYNSDLRPLSSLNDGGRSFEEIADILEAQPNRFDPEPALV